MSENTGGNDKGALWRLGCCAASTVWRLRCCTYHDKDYHLMLVITVHWQEAITKHWRTIIFCRELNIPADKKFVSTHVGSQLFMHTSYYYKMRSHF